MIDHATAPPCQINVPALHAQADGTGVQTGHVTGACTFRWHSVNLIQFKDRWHTLGVEEHGPYAPRVHVSEPADRDDYHGDGYWREVVKVYDVDGRLRARIVGPVSEFAS